MKSFDKTERDAMKAAYRVLWPAIIKGNRVVVSQIWPHDWTKFMTPIELNLWLEFEYNGLIFYPQMPCGNYFIDFANPLSGIAIEADGLTYHKDKIKEQQRDTYLKQHGYPHVFHIETSGIYNQATVDLLMGDIIKLYKQPNWLSPAEVPYDAATEAAETVINHETEHQEAKHANKVKKELTKAQDHFLALILHNVSLRNFRTGLKADIFVTKYAKIVFNFLCEHPDFNNTDTTMADFEKLTAVKPYMRKLVKLYDNLYKDLEFLELRYEATRLQARLIEQYVQTKKYALVMTLADANESVTLQTLNRMKQLDALLKLDREEISL